MDVILIAIVAFGGAVLTFFSGFGLGTLLLPVFMLFFPVDVAVALTALVHLANNLFKTGLMGRYADWKVVLGFGLAALPGAWFGAWLLARLSTQPILHAYTLGPVQGEISLIKIIVAALMIIFAGLEVLPDNKQPVFSTKALPLGGFLSGFFGGLSGHQGALRSAFLLRLGLTKEAFIGTGIIIACGIDLVRLSVYFSDGHSIHGDRTIITLMIAAGAAISGAWLGNRLLKKITLTSLKWFVATGILLMAIALVMGIL
jgi:uncharacterized membrane protein YfcA